MIKLDEIDDLLEQDHEMILSLDTICDIKNCWSPAAHLVLCGRGVVFLCKKHTEVYKGFLDRTKEARR